MASRNEQQQKITGFTIVELLVVIVVIGILATLSVVAYTGIQNQVKAVVLKNDLQAAASHLEVERGWSNSYPADLATAKLPSSDGTVYQYTVDNNSRPITYCLSALNMSIIGTSFYITDEGKIKDGVCPGHSGNPGYTNLANNSSFEEASSTVTVQTNYVINPRAAVNNSYYLSTIGGGSGTFTRVATGGPSGIGTFVRGQPSGEGSYTYVDARYQRTGVATLTPGAGYVWEPWIRPVSPIPLTVTLYIQWFDASSTLLSTSTINLGSKTSNIWERVSTGRQTAPTGAVSATLIARAWPASGTFGYTTAMDLSGGTLTVTGGEYFDGSTSASSDFTYSWTGTANASASVQQAPKVTGFVGHPTSTSRVYQSKEWSSNGIASVAITAAPGVSTDTFAQFGLPVEQGKTYTILAKANMPNDSYPGASTTRKRTICIYGGQSVTGGVETASESAPIGVGTARLVFTATATGTAQVRLYSGAATQTAWWDDLLVVEGEYTGPYFQ